MRLNHSRKVESLSLKVVIGSNGLDLSILHHLKKGVSKYCVSLFPSSCSYDYEISKRKNKWLMRSENDRFLEKDSSNAFLENVLANVNIHCAKWIIEKQNTRVGIDSSMTNHDVINGKNNKLELTVLD